MRMRAVVPSLVKRQLCVKRRISAAAATKTPCCVCKDGYDGTDATDAAVIPDLTDENVCKITKCTKKVAENCVEKDANDKCILCIVGYKLDIKTNTCLESCTDLTDRY